MSTASAVNSTVVSHDSEWHFLPQRHLTRYNSHACITISRATLMTMMCTMNARKAFQYSDAAGFRAGYASYNGQWYITWPIGTEAMVSFVPHDSHSAVTDVYPPSFPQRVDRCVQMLAGVITAPTGSFKVAFCGRKPAGSYTLVHVSKGFPGAHGSRHLYNMMGGKVYEVDFMFAAKDREAPKDALKIELPSKSQDGVVEMFIPTREAELIEMALDSLPWTSLSWSIHRGMRDILVAYARPTMDDYRKQLADLLRQTVMEKPYLLEGRGWNAQFVRESMGEMAASAILAAGGNSGDSVRVVADIVLALVSEQNMAQLDQVNFWRKADRSLDLHGVVALTKVFVLEWSNEFDYQLYHELPVSLFFG